MLVTPQLNQRNRTIAAVAATVVGSCLIGLSLLSPFWLFAAPFALGVFFWIRRPVQRRSRLMKQAFPDSWNAILQHHVAFFRALQEEQKDRFRQMVAIFLDETPITGVRTDVDDKTRVLVAASAVIPVFGFDDWEYSRLGEVLIYPGPFDENYGLSEPGEQHTLGMVGVGHLSGVMILSKPDLIGGFENPEDKRNVGIHEFAHLVDQADGTIDGLPPGVDAATAQPWIQWVGQELKSEADGKNHIDDYAYTNEAEYFAVLTEYFFEAPDVLSKKAPHLYRMMETMYRQNTKGLLSGLIRRPRRRIGRNSKCPCGSGKKYKHCCLKHLR